jgi:branched-chain amino acid transport system substrate-binding protein
MITKKLSIDGLLAILVLILLVSFGSAGAAAPPIKIGYLTPLTGNWAMAGADMRDAWVLHLAQIGNKVGGRDIQLIVEDTEGKPDVAMTKIRKLVEKDKVHILAGIHSSGEAYAARDYVHNAQVPLMICNAGADDLTQQKRSPYFFRSSFSNSQHNFIFGEWMVRKLGKRKLVIVGLDFPGSWEWCGSMAYSFIMSGGKVLQEMYSPMGTTDFAPYITAINREADLVYSFYTGYEAARYHTQYNEYGLYGKIQNSCGTGGIDETIYPQIGDIIVGTLATGTHGYPDDPAYKAFREAFQKRFGREPGSFGDSSYMGAMFVIEALKKIKGNIEEKETFLKTLKGIKIPNSGWGPLSFDEYQNTVHDVQIQKLVKVGNTFKIDVIDKVPEVGQFWHYTPEEFFKKVPNWAQMKGKWVEYKPSK